MASQKLTYETLLNQKKEYIKKVLEEMTDLRRSVSHLISREVMIQEDNRSRARELYDTCLIQRLDLSMRDGEQKRLEDDLRETLRELDRAMMETEDATGKYHREWKISDERRYLIKKRDAAIEEL